mmetsp:Transcript_30038/g.52741  ORF Transcript_30038/g.52741 Transcript_30038/m.52741 type:complete len:210 (-) Transcript_30038:78-707(-)
MILKCLESLRVRSAALSVSTVCCSSEIAFSNLVLNRKESMRNCMPGISPSVLKNRSVLPRAETSPSNETHVSSSSASGLHLARATSLSSSKTCSSMRNNASRMATFGILNRARAILMLYERFESIRLITSFFFFLLLADDDESLSDALPVRAPFFFFFLIPNVFSSRSASNCTFWSERLFQHVFAMFSFLIGFQCSTLSLAFTSSSFFL